MCLVSSCIKRHFSLYQVVSSCILGNLRLLYQVVSSCIFVFGKLYHGVFPPYKGDTNTSTNTKIMLQERNRMVSLWLKYVRMREPGESVLAYLLMQLLLWGCFTANVVGIALLLWFGIVPALWQLLKVIVMGGQGGY